MFRVMLDDWYTPRLCWTEDDDPEDMVGLGYLDTSRFYSTIPLGWMRSVEGALNGACSNL